MYTSSSLSSPRVQESPPAGTRGEVARPLLPSPLRRRRRLRRRRPGGGVGPVGLPLVQAVQRLPRHPGFQALVRVPALQPAHAHLRLAGRGRQDQAGVQVQCLYVQDPEPKVRIRPECRYSACAGS